jgi:hypothetical protein
MTELLGPGGRLFVSKVLNHAEGGITHIYDRYGYMKEKRQALDAWSDKLQTILDGSSTQSD